MGRDTGEAAVLWLNRPRAARDMSLEIVNDDGSTVAVVYVRTSEEVSIEVQRVTDDPPVHLYVQ